ncbi:YqzE family protein [Marinicrinis lubricantis]|uniref:YqzE family protein n=1 Tax=Marinicrinis lubricantis TaxID=2086470 RepID=A0ABW1INR4_9BACL
MASGQDLLKYITQQLVRYMETPKEERRSSRKIRKPKEDWGSRWFGMMPLSLKMTVPRKKQENKKPPEE